MTPRTVRDSGTGRGLRPLLPIVGSGARLGDAGVVVTEHAHDGGWGGVPAPLGALGDDQAGSDLAQAEVLVAQMQGHGQHGLIGDGGTADGLAVLAGGLVALQGAVANVFAFHPGQGQRAR